MEQRGKTLSCIPCSNLTPILGDSEIDVRFTWTGPVNKQDVRRYNTVVDSTVRFKKYRFQNCVWYHPLIALQKRTAKHVVTDALVKDMLKKYNPPSLVSRCAVLSFGFNCSESTQHRLA